MVVLTSFTQPTDGIRHRQPNTTVYVNDNNLGKGTLYIAESRLSWIGDSGNGFSLEYPHISLHAICRDLTAFPQDCLFLMLDTAVEDDDNNEGEGENENENGEDDQGSTELRFVPDDRGMLDAMFHAMNACQALHPDPEDSFSEEDFFEDADEEIPMEETDSRMASLRIENMDGRGGMELGRAVDREAVDMEVVDRGWSIGALGRVAGMGAEGNVGVEEVDTESDREVGRVADRVVGRLADRVGGRVEGISVDRVGGRVEGISVDRVGGRVEGISADRVGGRVGGISADRVGGMVGGISAYRAEDDMGQGDRSFFGDNTWPQNRTARFPPPHEAHTDLQEDSNFDDVEN